MLTNQTFIKKEKEIEYHKACEDDFYEITEPHNSSFFNGTIFFLNSDETKLKYRMKKLHNTITCNMTNYSVSIQKVRNLSSFLKEFFPATYIDHVVKRICDKGYLKHVVADEDRISLILSYLSLYYASRKLIISEKVLSEISSLMGLSVNIEQIQKQYFLIHKLDPLFYKKYSVNLAKIKSIRFLQLFKEYFFSENIQTTLPVSDINDIFNVAQKTCIEYSACNDFKHQKYSGYETTILALIAHAYRLVTGKRGIPFDLSDRERKYLVEKRSLLKKKLNKGKY